MSHCIVFKVIAQHKHKASNHIFPPSTHHIFNTSPPDVVSIMDAVLFEPAKHLFF